MSRFLSYLWALSLITAKRSTGIKAPRPVSTSSRKWRKTTTRAGRLSWGDWFSYRTPAWYNRKLDSAKVSLNASAGINLVYLTVVRHQPTKLAQPKSIKSIKARHIWRLIAICVTRMINIEPGVVVVVVVVVVVKLGSSWVYFFCWLVREGWFEIFGVSTSPRYGGNTAVVVQSGRLRGACGRAGSGRRGAVHLFTPRLPVVLHRRRRDRSRHGSSGQEVLRLHSQRQPASPRGRRLPIHPGTGHRSWA